MHFKAQITQMSRVLHVGKQNRISSKHCVTGQAETRTKQHSLFFVFSARGEVISKAAVGIIHRHQCHCRLSREFHLCGLGFLPHMRMRMRKANVSREASRT